MHPQSDHTTINLNSADRSALVGDTPVLVGETPGEGDSG